MAAGYRLTLNPGPLKAASRRGAVEGLHNGTEHLLQVARSKVPLEEGTLERSGQSSFDDGALSSAVSFDTVYAVRQHEETTWQHDHGREAKYLEKPSQEEAPTIVALIAEATKRALGL